FKPRAATEGRPYKKCKCDDQCYDVAFFFRQWVWPLAFHERALMLLHHPRRMARHHPHANCAGTKWSSTDSSISPSTPSPTKNGATAMNLPHSSIQLTSTQT